MWFQISRKDKMLDQINCIVRQWDLGFWCPAQIVMEIFLWRACLFILDKGVSTFDVSSHSKEHYSDAWHAYFNMSIFDPNEGVAVEKNLAKL